MTTLAGIAVAAIVTIFLVFSNSSSAQEGTTGESAHGCKFGAKGFERRSVPIHEITARFISKPTSRAEAARIKEHVVYSLLLSKVSFNKVLKTSLGRCAFGAEIGVSLDLRFELFNINQNVHDECSFGYCARLLSGEIQSLRISQQTFSNTINSMVEAERRRDSIDFRLPRLSAERAEREAYRHIYPAGARERIFDISQEDFESVAFEDFIGWFKQQQGRLRNFEQEDDSPGAGAPLPAEPRREPNCGPVHEVDLQELDIDHHGWGHRALILIKRGYTPEARSGIENTTLREFCDAGDHDALEASPWREMAGEVRCFRRELYGGDRWLILFSAREPAKTSAEMLRFARGIAQKLSGGGCVDPELRVFVANFLKQD